MRQSCLSYVDRFVRVSVYLAVLTCNSVFEFIVSKNSRCLRVNTDSYSCVDVYLMRTATSRSLNHLYSDTSTLTYISSDISRRELRSVYRDISTHDRTCCPIDPDVVYNLHMYITQRNWKSVDIYETKFHVIC